MKLKKKYVLLLALLVLTALLTMWYQTTREAIPENAILVRFGEKTAYLDIAKLGAESVHGTLVNGKGQETTVDAKGQSLAAALESLQFDIQNVQKVTVTAQDTFCAELAGQELRQEGKVYLIADDEGPMLVVFGDTNAKRRVRQVECIDLE